MEDNNCDSYVPFSHYDWSFDRRGRLPWNPAAYCLIASFCAVAYWMSLELLVLVWITFKRRTGLYFWSIVITTLGVILQTTGYLLKEFASDANPVLTSIICKIGWISNVSGFAVVLWSRLHLVINDPRIMRAVLIMIIINAVVLHTPMVVFEFGQLTRHKETYKRVWIVFERIQQTTFTLQEVIISLLYIVHTRRFLDSGYSTQTRTVVRMLMLVQACVIAFDAALTTFSYKKMLVLKFTFHPFVYALKLKLEFVVLNQLLTLVKNGLSSGVGRRTLDSSSLPAMRMPNSDRDSPPNVATFIITSPIANAEIKTSTLEKGTQSHDVVLTEPNLHSHDKVVSRKEIQRMSSDEDDLRDIIGSPDSDSEENIKVGTEDSDVEQQSLWRGCN